MTEEYKAPDFKFVVPTEDVQGEAVAEEQVPVEAVEPASPGATEVLQDMTKELSSAMTRYFNGLVMLTTGAERALQQLARLVGTKVVETGLLRKYHKLDDAVTSNVAAILTWDIKHVTSAILAIALDNTEANQNVLKSAEAALEGDVAKLRDAFPADTYAHAHFTEWLNIINLVTDGLQRCTDGFVVAGKAAGVAEADIRLIIASLEDAVDEWVEELMKQQTQELPADVVAHMDTMAAASETTFAELRKTLDVREAIIGTVSAMRNLPHDVESKSEDIPET